MRKINIMRIYSIKVTKADFIFEIDKTLPQTFAQKSLPKSPSFFVTSSKIQYRKNHLSADCIGIMLRLTSLCKGFQTAILEAFDQHLTLLLHILQMVEQMWLHVHYPFALFCYLLEINRLRHFSFMLGQIFIMVLLDYFPQVCLFLLGIHAA